MHQPRTGSNCDSPCIALSTSGPALAKWLIVAYFWCQSGDVEVNSGQRIFHVKCVIRKPVVSTVTKFVGQRCTRARLGGGRRRGKSKLMEERKEGGKEKREKGKGEGGTHIHSQELASL